MTKEKLIEAVRIAYNFGIEQTNKRIEPRDTIISWCGYGKLPKVHENTIYASYKSGLHNRQDDKTEYRFFMVIDEKLAILTDEHGQIYKFTPPYKSPDKITYETYCEIVHGGISPGVVHNSPTFKKLDKIRKDLIENDSL
jgi:hypothetical protein